MDTKEINRLINVINKALNEEDYDFQAVIVLDQDIEELIKGEG